MNLLEYIQKKNQETQKWIDENPGSFAGMFTEDLEHWHSYNVYTPEDFDKYLLKALIWDGFKDVHGVRPRHLNLDKMSIEELKAELESIQTYFEAINNN